MCNCGLNSTQTEGNTKSERVKFNERDHSKRTEKEIIPRSFGFFINIQSEPNKQTYTFINIFKVPTNLSR